MKTAGTTSAPRPCNGCGRDIGIYQTSHLVKSNWYCGRCASIAKQVKTGDEKRIGFLEAENKRLKNIIIKIQKALNG